MLMRPFIHLPSCYILLKVLLNIHFSSWRYSYLVGYFVFAILNIVFYISTADATAFQSGLYADWFTNKIAKSTYYKNRKFTNSSALRKTFVDYYFI